LALHL
jgi:hypothetical protein